MNHDPNFSQLLRKTLAAILWCAALVVLCDQFLDRPVAYFVAERKLPDDSALRWLTEPPPILQAWTPAVLAALVIRRAFGPFRRWEQAVLAACVSMVLADQCRESMSFLFGRYWPETWTNNNPSLIKDGAYGFHPFHAGTMYGSFPSGHTARVLAVAASVWVASPRWGAACGLLSISIAVAMVGMNYHFVGDVIAGGFVGAIVGVYTARLCGLDRAVHSLNSVVAPHG